MRTTIETRETLFLQFLLSSRLSSILSILFDRAVLYLHASPIIDRQCASTANQPIRHCQRTIEPYFGLFNFFSAF